MTNAHLPNSSSKPSNGLEVGLLDGLSPEGARGSNVIKSADVPHTRRSAATPVDVADGARGL